MLILLAVSCLRASGVDALPGAPPRDRELDRRLWAAVDGERPPYVNRLVLERSPYLRLHAHDPVDWHPWGPEALARAGELDRPIFLSIGYSTCHWCHVMQDESFRDPEVAAAINAAFVPIKVDREERPDLDQVYLAAVQAMIGRAGWPATLVLTPDGQVVFAGTYLPPRDGDRGAARGLVTVLRQLADGWRDDRERLLAEAESNSRAVREAAAPRPPGEVPGPERVAEVVARFRRAYDPEHGGFGQGQKFPRPAALDLLLARGEPGEVAHTLRAMADGGLRDRVGGGFHRYTLDRAWRVPHFEKMTEDNALLVVTYADAWAATGDAAFAEIARETLGSLSALALPAGGYGTALDADSVIGGERVEGAYYTWTPAELVEVLRDPGAPAALGVGGDGAIDGRWVLRPTGSVDPGWWGSLRRARAARPAPALDDKWVVGTNARVVSALAHAARVLGDPEALRGAIAAADRIQRDGRLPDGRLRHGSTSDAVGLLEDHALVAQAWLDLLEVTADPRWLDEAIALMDQVEARYADPLGGWFRTPDDADTALFRPRDQADTVGASGASAAVLAAQRLAVLTGDPRWTERADRALGSYANALGTALPTMTEAVARRNAPGPEIVVAWPDGADPEPLLAVVRGSYVPGATVLTGAAGKLGVLSERVPLLRDKDPGDQPTAWVCEGGVCQAPARDPDALRAALAAARSGGP